MRKEKCTRAILPTSGELVTRYQAVIPTETLRPSTFDGQNWEPSDSLAKLYWLDKSNQRNHATAYGSPSLDQNTQNGLKLMTYSGANGEFHEWEKINDIRTVFWVVRKNGTDSNRFLLGSTDDYNFHSNGNNYFHNGHASIAANADIRENGNSITNPSGTALPPKASVLFLYDPSLI